MINFIEEGKDYYEKPKKLKKQVVSEGTMREEEDLRLEESPEPYPDLN
jgi:hypothetical protein